MRINNTFMNPLLIVVALLMFSCTNVKQEISTETTTPSTTAPPVITETTPIEKIVKT